MSRLKSIYGLMTARKMYWLLLLWIFFLLFFLSLNAGISGDEHLHYQHSEYVNNYFEVQLVISKKPKNVHDYPLSFSRTFIFLLRVYAPL